MPTSERPPLISDNEYCVWPLVGQSGATKAAVGGANGRQLNSEEEVQHTYYRAGDRKSIPPARVESPIHPLLLKGMIRAMQEDDLQFQIEQLDRRITMAGTAR